MKKTKLIASIVAFGLIIAIMGFGVWAATATSFDMSNKMSFTPAGVEAFSDFTITGVIYSGADADTASDAVTAGPDQSITYSYRKATATGVTMSDWNMPNFDFNTTDKINFVIILTIIIPEDANNEAMRVTLTPAFDLGEGKTGAVVTTCSSASNGAEQATVDSAEGKFIIDCPMADDATTNNGTTIIRLVYTLAKSVAFSEISNTISCALNTVPVTP